MKSVQNELTLTEEVLDAAAYFSALGYQVTPAFAETFFRCFAALSEDEKRKRRSIADFTDIFSSLLISNQDEDQRFADDFAAFLKRRRIITTDDQTRLYDQIEHNQYKAKMALRKAEMYKKSAEQIKDAIAKCESAIDLNHVFFNDDEIAKMEKSIEKQGHLFTKITGIRMTYIRSITQAKSPDDIIAYRQRLKKAALKIVMSDDHKSLTHFAKAQAHMADTALKKLSNNPATQLTKLKNSYQNYDQLYHASQKEADDYTIAAHPDEFVTVIRSASYRHRDVFIPDGHAVISSGLGESLISTSFKKLSEKDITRMREFIRDHVQQFRTRVLNNIRTTFNHHIDFAKTCQKACATGGVPIRLAMVRPKHQKTRLVLLLDISGSCKEASIMMLTFMQIMASVFGGGCHFFAFVNSLYDMTNAISEGEAPEDILSRIPTRGVYSNYELPLTQFCHEQMHLINKDTIIIFIGDARNNHNPTGEDELKAICRKARSAYWINTEDQASWDSGDSIMSVYAKYMNKYAAAFTTGDLIAFLMEVK